MVNGAKRAGVRCAICTQCGACFETETDARVGWSGERCDICVGCGTCMRQWGLISGREADAESGPTNWADAFKVMDTGFAGDAPPVPGAPGVAPRSTQSDEEADAATGATPGVASGCAEFGLDDMASLHERLGIKPPGVA